MITEENRIHEKDQKISADQPTKAKQKTSVRGKYPKLKGSIILFKGRGPEQEEQKKNKNRMLAV